MNRAVIITLSHNYKALNPRFCLSFLVMASSRNASKGGNILQEENFPPLQRTVMPQSSRARGGTIRAVNSQSQRIADEAPSQSSNATRTAPRDARVGHSGTRDGRSRTKGPTTEPATATSSAASRAVPRQHQVEMIADFADDNAILPVASASSRGAPQFFPPEDRFGGSFVHQSSWQPAGIAALRGHDIGGAPSEDESRASGSSSFRRNSLSDVNTPQLASASAAVDADGDHSMAADGDASAAASHNSGYNISRQGDIGFIQESAVMEVQSSMSPSRRQPTPGWNRGNGNVTSPRMVRGPGSTVAMDSEASSKRHRDAEATRNVFPGEREILQPCGGRGQRTTRSQSGGRGRHVDQEQSQGDQTPVLHLQDAIPRDSARSGARSGGRSNRGDMNPIEALGRSMTAVLRHQAADRGLNLRSDGYAAVSAVLKLNMRTFANRHMSSHTVEDVRLVVATDKKQRFSLVEEEEGLMIRANQGHSISTVLSEDLLKEIKTAEEVKECIHGTYRKHLDSIFSLGLSRMKRNHIHFATGLPQTGGVISGMRSSCEVLIYLNVELALQNGIKLYLSENNVVLSDGIHGCIPKDFFLKVVLYPSMKPIPIP